MAIIILRFRIHAKTKTTLTSLNKLVGVTFKVIYLT